MADGDDQQVQLDDPVIPAGVRKAVIARWEQGESLWRCPRAKGGNRLFNSQPQRIVIEWWLIDSNGGLVEAFWES